MTEHHEKCCKPEEQCKSGHKHHHDHHEGHYELSAKYLQLADEAWMELLKEKIKADIEKNKADELEKLAEIISKANGKRWEHKINSKMNCDEYKDTLKDFYTSKNK